MAALSAGETESGPDKRLDLFRNGFTPETELSTSKLYRNGIETGPKRIGRSTFLYTTESRDDFGPFSIHMPL
eukprot:2901719-Prymnesium_polylepis.1